MRIRSLIACLCILSFCVSSNSIGMDDPSKRTHDLQKILKLVELGETNIENLEQKDVVIVVGRTQVGKSTTINSFLGARFCFDEGEDGQIILESSTEHDGLANMGGKGLSCTMLPRMHTVRGHRFSFLDTRGFFDVMKDPEGDIASSILTEMAIKKAKSVRLMFLEEFGNIQKGVVAFRDIGTTLGKIVVGEKVPALFLFNRYNPPQNQAPAFYRKSPDQQEKTINESIKKSIVKVLEGEETVFSVIAKDAADRLGLAFEEIKNFFGNENKDISKNISSDHKVQEAIAGMSYTVFLKYNYDEDHIGYIDPMSYESVENALNKLEQLPIISPSSLVFNGYNSSRIEFDEALMQEVSPLLLLMKAKAHVSKYSLKFLSEWKEEATYCLKYHKLILENLRNLSISSDDLEGMELAYSIKVEDKENQKKRLEKNKKDLEKKINELNNDIIKIIEGNPILYWTDVWRKEVEISSYSSLLWRNHHCVYPAKVDFVNWKQNLGSMTIGYPIEPTLSAWRWNLIVQENCDGEHRDEKDRRSAADKKDTLSFVGSPYLSLWYSSRYGGTCEGRVEVYVAPKNDPSSVAKIKMKKIEIIGIEKSILEINGSLGDLQNRVKNDLNSKISSNIRVFEQQVKKLDMAIYIRTKVDKLYKNKDNQIELCVRIANKLETNKPIIEDFRNFYHEVGTIIKTEKNKIPNLMDDIFSTHLLDPVQLTCSGSHARSYERRMIAEHIKRNGTCPDCREKVSNFIPIGILVGNVGDIIDGISSDTSSASNIIENL